MNYVYVSTPASNIITNLNIRKSKPEKFSDKCESLFLLRLLLRVLWHANEPVKEYRSRDIERDVDEEKTKVAPSLAVIRTDLSQERIRIRERAERAIGGCVRIKQITASCLDIIA